MQVFTPVMAMGSLGWLAGGHRTAPALTILNALMNPENNMTSVKIKITMPKTPLGIAGFFLFSAGDASMLNNQ
jgi:hypothetical protein